VSGASAFFVMLGRLGCPHIQVMWLKTCTQGSGCTCVAGSTAGFAHQLNHWATELGKQGQPCEGYCVNMCTLGSRHSWESVGVSAMRHQCVCSAYSVLAVGTGSRVVWNRVAHFWLCSMQGCEGSAAGTQALDGGIGAHLCGLICGFARGQG
jgi:hypothetical protein